MKSAFALALAMGALAPISAQAAVYRCEMNASGASDGSWIPPETIVEYDSGASKAKVYDGLIKDIYGHPIEAKIAVNNDKRITFSWKVTDVPVVTTESKQTLAKSLVYRLTITKGSLEARETMKPLRFENTFRSKGKCVEK